MEKWINEFRDYLFDCPTEIEAEYAFRIMVIANYSEVADNTVFTEENLKLPAEEIYHLAVKCFEDEYKISAVEKLTYPVDDRLLDEFIQTMRKMEGADEQIIIKNCVVILSDDVVDKFNERVQTLLTFAKDNPDLSLVEFSCVHFALYNPGRVNIFANGEKH